jgi:hypothetical protein
MCLKRRLYAYLDGVVKMILTIPANTDLSFFVMRLSGSPRCRSQGKAIDRFNKSMYHQEIYHIQVLPGYYITRICRMKSKMAVL